MKKATRIIGNIGAAILLVTAGIVVWKLVTTKGDYEQTDDAQVEQYMSPINVRSAGYIKEIRFKEHQYVHKGDTLVIIDPREYQIAVKSAEASLMEARNGINSLSATRQTASSNTGAIDAQIQEAKINAAQKKADYDRYAKLLEQKAATPMTVEQYRTNYEMAKARVAALESQSRAAKSQEQEVTEKNGSVQASILKAEAALEKAKLDLAYTVIIAPTDGYIGKRGIEEGQLVSTGQTITTIMSGSSKWITANFKETQVEDLFVGQRVEIKIDAFKGRTFTGRVSAISSATGAKYSLLQSDNSGSNFVKIQQRVPVRIDFTDLTEKDNDRLAAGMMCEVKVKKNKKVRG